MKIWLPHKTGLTHLGHLPASVAVEVADDPDRLPSDPAGVEFLVPTFLGQPSLRPILSRLGDLRVLQLPSAGSDGWAGLVPAHVAVADARGVHDAATSEWVLAAILAQLRNLPALQRAQRAGIWRHGSSPGLRGRRVLLIGAGSIGSAVARRLAPFEVELTEVARTARPAEGVHGVDEVPALLPRADVVIVLVPLTTETRGLVDRDFLAALPDGALVVNASRGPVVDTAALLNEVNAGRLTAALDVTDPEPLPPGHPLWWAEGVLITPHVGAFTEDLLDRVYALVAEQVDRYLAGRPLRNLTVR